MKLFFICISVLFLSVKCKKDNLPSCGEVTSVAFYEINEADKIVVSIVVQFPAPGYQEKFVFIDDRDDKQFWEENYRINPPITICRSSALYRLLLHKR